MKIMEKIREKCKVSTKMFVFYERTVGKNNNCDIHGL